MRWMILLLSTLPALLYAGESVMLECRGKHLSDQQIVRFVFTINTEKKTIKDNHGVNYGVYNWNEDTLLFGLRKSTDEQGNPLIWNSDKIDTVINISRVLGTMEIANGSEPTHKGSCKAKEKLF